MISLNIQKRRNLTFNSSPIWPDKSTVKWEMDGKGFVDGKLRFLIHTNEHSSDPFSCSCFVAVLEDVPSNQDTIEESPLFCNINEWSKLYEKPMNSNQYHCARQAAMCWAEKYCKKHLIK